MTRTVPDMTGERYGRLTVTGRTASDHRGRSRWACECDCGRAAVYRRCVLISGEARSCGCLRRAANRSNGRKGRQAQLQQRRHTAREADGGRTLAACWTCAGAAT